MTKTFYEVVKDNNENAVYVGNYDACMEFIDFNLYDFKKLELHGVAYDNDILISDVLIDSYKYL